MEIWWYLEVMDAAVKLKALLATVPSTEEERLSRRKAFYSIPGEVASEAFAILSMFSCEEEGDPALYSPQEVADRFARLSNQLA